MWTVAIPTARTTMTPHELREVAAGYFFLPSPCLAPVVGSQIILPSTEHNPVTVDLHGDALMNLPAPETLTGVDELKDLVPDAELSLPAFNVVTGSYDPRSLKSTLLEFKTMRYGVKYTSVPWATAVDRFERSLLGDIQRGLAARDAAWHNTEPGQKGPLRDILDMSEYTGMVFGTVGERGVWAFSFDLHDGYYALGLREDVRDYFTITVCGTLWRFAALPMGWSLSPYYFCTLMAVMVRYLRQPGFATYSSYGRPFRRRLRHRKARGVCLLPFIDDFMFLAPSRQLALRLRAEIERVWGRLDMAKHPTKGHFLYLAMHPASLYLREAHTVLGRCSSPSGKVVLTRQLIRDLEWWRDVPTRHNGAPIVATAYLHTDSSQYGWAINPFFTDNFKEPPALGPFINHAMRGWELAQPVLDTPDYRLPNDDLGTWTAATASEWVTAAALAVDATPPAGFCWSSHSLRSGGASAASATGLTMPTAGWLGGWAVGSGVVLNYIVPDTMDSAGARYFFGFMAPQRSAANLSQ
eukprot:jgi/Tetstr1/466470/TSEL_000979.t1